MQPKDKRLVQTRLTRGTASVADEDEVQPAGAQGRAGTDAPRRRIVTRLHSGDLAEESAHRCNRPTPPVRISWAAHAWADGIASDASIRRRNRHVAVSAPVDADADTPQAAPPPCAFRTALWRHLAKTIRTALMHRRGVRPGRNAHHRD